MNSPVCLHLWWSALVDSGVESVQLLHRGLWLLRSHRCCGGGRSSVERLRRRWLAEVVDAGVVGVHVIVIHVREGTGVGGGVARVDIGITWVITVIVKKARSRATEM